MNHKSGIYKDVPEDEYHSWDLLSKSTLSDFSQNPGKFKLKEKEETNAMKIGTAIDNLLFGGEEQFWNKYTIHPKYKGAGSVAKNKEWETKNAAFIHINQKQADDCFNAAEAVKKYDLANQYLKEAHTQLSLVWKCEETGLMCKARPDIKPSGENMQFVMCDLKSTVDASYNKFRKIFTDMKYHWQAVHYSDGWEAITGDRIEEFVFIVVEKEFPYMVAVYTFDRDSDDWGLAEEQIIEAKKYYAECKQKNNWPLNPTKKIQMKLSNYVWYQ